MVNLSEYKQRKKQELIVLKLAQILDLFKEFEIQLHPYRFYVPAQDVLESIRNNRTFAKLAVKRIREDIDGKKKG